MSSNLTLHPNKIGEPLNVITLGRTESDNIKRMITIIDCFYIVSYSKWDFKL